MRTLMLIKFIRRAKAERAHIEAANTGVLAGAADDDQLPDPVAAAARAMGPKRDRALIGFLDT
jgi:hypothetical protein